MTMNFWMDANKSSLIRNLKMRLLKCFVGGS